VNPDQPPEEKLLPRHLCEEKPVMIRGHSLRVPNTERAGLSTDSVRIYTRRTGRLNCQPGSPTCGAGLCGPSGARFQCGRQKWPVATGNKGINQAHPSARDMPYLARWHTIDIVLNPFGVPSRMNVGQGLRMPDGLGLLPSRCRVKVVPFDEMHATKPSKNTVQKYLRRRLPSWQGLGLQPR